jgi:aminoglycoside/choline kinase family phosphotransferase
MTDRLQLLRDWLRVDLKLVASDLSPASEDASFRRYYRIAVAGDSYIVMDAPPDKEDCGPFLDVTERLLNCGVNAPKVFAKDLDKGFLLLSDLGAELYLDKLNDNNADELYGDAINALLKIQAYAVVDNLPDYTESLLMQEMTLFRDWLLDKHLRKPLTGKALKQLEEVFVLLVKSAMSQPQLFVHRDFHSRNLILNKNNPGIIDYQDAVLGPISYDLVSLLKDCYVKWPQSKVEQWTQEYYKQISDVMNVQLSKDDFKRCFDLMGVQRHLKASGIFARLYHRDHKPDYLKDIPRTLSYIVDLKDEYPELHNLIALLQDNVLPAMKDL